MGNQKGKKSQTKEDGISKCKDALSEDYTEIIEEALEQMKEYKKIQKKRQEEKLREDKKREDEIYKITHQKPLFSLKDVLTPVVQVKAREDILSIDKDCDCLDAFYEIDKEMEKENYQGVITLDSLIEKGYAHYKDNYGV